MTRENLDRYALAARIHELLAPELDAEGWELVDVRVFRGGGRLQVRLYVDLVGEERINLDGCARASRSASMFLEEADFFSEAWVLEVSSPGIRRPLRTEAHFAAAVGSDVELKWRTPNAPTQKPLSLRGRLEAVVDGALTMRSVTSVAAEEDASGGVQFELVTVPLSAVLEANLEHDFDVQAVIREDRRRRKEAKRDRRDERRKKRGGKSGRPDGTVTKGEKDERDGS